MQIKTFRIGMEDAAAEAELNTFLRSVRVLQVQKEFVDLGTNSFWRARLPPSREIRRLARTEPRPPKNRMGMHEANRPSLFLDLRS